MEHAELVQFLNVGARIDVKCIAIQHVLGMTGTQASINYILQNKDILICLPSLLQDKEHIIRKDAMLSLVNLSASEEGAIKIMELRSHNSNEDDIINTLATTILNEKEKNADAACMLLCNLSRVGAYLEKCVEILYPHLASLLSAFVNLSYNKSGESLHYLGPLWSNLSGSKRIRKWLSTGGVLAPLIKLCSFSSFESSVIRRGGAVATIRNVCFDSDIHDWLLSSEVNILCYLLLPLMGGDEYPDEEMDSLPIDLQYQPPNKQRESDPDIRVLLLETLARFCVKKAEREFLRNNGVYYILRELHKWEKDRKSLLACENVIDILIRKEEMGAEDLLAVDVPSEYHEKFKKMDEDFLNDT